MRVNEERGTLNRFRGNASSISLFYRHTMQGNPHCLVTHLTRCALSNDLGHSPACWAVFDAVINCTEMTRFAAGLIPVPPGKAYLHLKIAEGKKGQSQLFNALPAAIAFIRNHVFLGKSVLVHCAQGHDRSVGIVLAALLALADDDGRRIVNR
jgi:protein-tyrosine phosphatase